MPKLRQGLSPLLTESVCQKLRNGKIKTVLDFIQSDYDHLNKIAQLSYKEVLAIRKVLFAQYAVYPMNAADMLNDMLSNRAIFSTGCSRFDECLGGGIFTSDVTEIIGVSASGKTQFCLSFLIQVALINKLCAFYIDTNNAVTNLRIKEMAFKSGTSKQEFYNFQTSRVRIAQVHDIFTLFKILETLRADLINKSTNYHSSLRLLVIDSVNPLISSVLFGSNNEGFGLMVQLAHLLKNLSSEFSLAVVITNSCIKTENTTERAALGPYWQHVPNIRILMNTCEENKRRLTLVKSTRTATGFSQAINITAKGIEESA